MNSPNISKHFLKKSFWNGKKVLVTGHTGFKGSWLTIWLLKLGAEVVGFSLEEEKNSLFSRLKIKSNIDHNINDIRNRNALDKVIKFFKPDIVFHLAAQPLVKIGYSKPLLTWEINLMGTINLLNCLSELDKNCIAIFATTDKVYKNNEWIYGYREEDPLGGFDPYSASKAACEIAISSWRSCHFWDSKYQDKNLLIASVRAGNILGGGDWSEFRIMPDIIKSLLDKKVIKIRNPYSTRPWQHVLEPLSGYLSLAKTINDNPDDDKFCSSFNFGPKIESNRQVLELVNCSLKFWEGRYEIDKYETNQKESKLLNLNIDKAYNLLNWSPILSFEKTVEKTIEWYKNVLLEKEDALKECIKNIQLYQNELTKNN